MLRQASVIHGLIITALSRLLRARLLFFFMSPVLLFHHINLDAEEKVRHVIFILSENAPVYNQVAEITQDIVNEKCSTSQANCSELVFQSSTANNLQPEEIKRAFLTVSLGTRAAEWLKKQSLEGNQLNAMLPYPARDLTHQSQHRTLAKIFIDQPYKRYFELIRATMPRAGRVGLLIHESDSDKISTITQSASEDDLKLRTALVDSEHDVGEALSQILNDVDVLLALPDAHIHNGHTISNILTTAYRNNIPVVGFSSAYVKAGATSAVFTSPEDIARQVADAILEFLQTGEISQHMQQATYFSISINFEVARSLGLPPTSPSDVKQAISREAVK